MPWSIKERGVLGIFAKRPDPGLVKSRLAVKIGEIDAARMYEAMLLDQLDLWGSERLLVPGGRRVLVFDPPDAGHWFDHRVPAGFALQPQSSGDLGTRMNSFIQGEFDAGARQLVLIGSDAPTVDPNFVRSAFLLLEQKDVVLGPATDGGYYLIGLRAPQPALFKGVAWGTSKVLGQTVARIESLGLRLAVLPVWYDVDTHDDLTAMRGHLRSMKVAGMPVDLPRTEVLLAALPA